MTPFGLLKRARSGWLAATTGAAVLIATALGKETSLQNCAAFPVCWFSAVSALELGGLAFFAWLQTLLVTSLPLLSMVVFTDGGLACTQWRNEAGAPCCKMGAKPGVSNSLMSKLSLASFHRFFGLIWL
jgi:hypothetical protein